MKNQSRNRSFTGINTLNEVLLLIIFYIFFGSAYYAVIYYTSQGTSDFIWQVLLDYSLKAMLTVPIWWLMFRKLNQLELWKKIGMHLILMPVWVFAWINTYYAICDAVGLWHLDGSASGWDIYIPTLFYILQFGFFHVDDYYRRFHEQLKRTAELRETTLRSELQALKSQINPHFLYNTFNTISASVPSEQEHTREMIAKLSDLFRYQLKASQHETVSLQEEIEFVRSYLDLEKARFGDRLHVAFRIPANTKSARVPPMILQPLVENAIRHGISPKIEGGSIIIESRKDALELFVGVRDTGIGIKEPEAVLEKGIGLSNTKKRILKRYGRNLDIQPNNPEGVSVSFVIPYAESTDNQNKIL